MGRYFAGVLLFICVYVGNVQAHTCREWNDTDLKPDDLVIGKVMVNNRNIFDTTKPDENHLIHRWANRLHIKTKKSVIEKQLLFQSGDKFDSEILEETERLLRANRYIKDASVKAVAVCDTNQVTVQVETTDHWTLAPGLSFGRSGGKNKSSVDIQEHNLLGWGKSLSLAYSQDSERDSTQLLYEDTLLLGSRKNFKLLIENNSDGDAYELNLGLPFYTFHSTKSWGINLRDQSEDISIYEQGDVVDKFSDDLKSASLFYGWAKPPVNDTVKRFRVGWEYSKDRFARLLSSNISKQIKQSYPWAEYEFFENKYAKLENFNTMGVTEDTLLGKRFIAQAGFLSPSFGSDNTYLRLENRFSGGLSFTDKHLGLIDLGVTNYLGKGNLQGFQSDIKGQYYYFKNRHNTFYVSGALKSTDNLQNNQQILLGGVDGLRGYPLGFQAGDKSALFTVEYRHFFDYYPWKLAKFGVVAFADVGSAWGRDKELDVLKDVGIGWRIVPTHSSSVKVLHLDIAFPLDANNQVSDVQFIVKTKKTF